MTDADTITVISLISQWWPAWRQPEDMKAMVKSWRILLADVDLEHAVAALTEHATAGSEFPPPPGVIRQRAIELTRPDGAAPTVEQAWGEVLAEISRVGYVHLSHKIVPDDRLPRFSHPAIEAVVTAMSWRELCESTTQMADRAHFTKMYVERVERDRQRVAAAPNVLALLAERRQLALEQARTAEVEA